MKKFWQIPGGNVEGLYLFSKAIFQILWDNVRLLEKDLQIKYEYSDFFMQDYALSKKNWIKQITGFPYDGLKKKVIILKFLGENIEVDISYNTVFSEYKWVNIDDLSNYLNDDFMEYLNLNLIKNIIC